MYKLLILLTVVGLALAIGQPKGNSTENNSKESGSANSKSHGKGWAKGWAKGHDNSSEVDHTKATTAAPKMTTQNNPRSASITTASGSSTAAPKSSATTAASAQASCKNVLCNNCEKCQDGKCVEDNGGWLCRNKRDPCAGFNCPASRECKLRNGRPECVVRGNNNNDATTVKPTTAASSGGGAQTTAASGGGAQTTASSGGGAQTTASSGGGAQTTAAPSGGGAQTTAAPSGGGATTASNKPKAGKCPERRYFARPICNGDQDEECKTDSDCSDEAKCCFNGCGMECMPPVTTKGGSSTAAPTTAASGSSTVAPASSTSASGSSTAGSMTTASSSGSGTTASSNGGTCHQTGSNGNVINTLPIVGGSKLADVCLKLACPTDRPCGVANCGNSANPMPVATCIDVHLCVGQCPLVCVNNLPIVGSLLSTVSTLGAGILGPDACVHAIDGNLLGSGLLSNVPLVGGLPLLGSIVGGSESATTAATTSNNNKCSQGSSQGGSQGSSNGGVTSSLPIVGGSKLADLCLQLLCPKDKPCGAAISCNGTTATPVVTCIDVHACVGPCPLICVNDLPIVGSLLSAVSGLLGGTGLLGSDSCVHAIDGNLLGSGLLSNLPLVGGLPLLGSITG